MSQPIYTVEDCPPSGPAGKFVARYLGNVVRDEAGMPRLFGTKVEAGEFGKHLPNVYIGFTPFGVKRREWPCNT